MANNSRLQGNYKKGKFNINEDALSRMEINTNGTHDQSCTVL